MAWICLVVAGLLEVGWAVGLKETQGFTRPIPTILTLIAFAASMGLLALAMRSIPIGTAYPVWVGIGALGTAILGMILYREPATVARIGFIALLVVSIVGIKLTSAPAAAPPPALGEVG